VKKDIQENGAPMPMRLTAASAGKKLDLSLILPFVNSTINVCTTMLNLKPEISKPHLKEDAHTTYDVSGVIGFSGEIVGSMVVSFQQETARLLVNALAGMKVEPNSADFIDAIGELANMIAGNAKKDLGLLANIAVPSVIIGHGHIVGRLSGVPCIVIPCKTSAGAFAVEINIKPNT
jgi:chemotaxis protein CheX